MIIFLKFLLCDAALTELPGGKNAVCRRHRLPLPCPQGPSTPAESPESSSVHRPFSPSRAPWADVTRCQTTHCLDLSIRTLERPHPDSWLAHLSSIWVTSMKDKQRDKSWRTLTCTFQWSSTEHTTALYRDLETLQHKAFPLKHTRSESKTELAFKLVVRKPPKSGATSCLETRFKSRLLNKKYVDQKHQCYYIGTYFSRLTLTVTLKHTHPWQHKQTQYRYSYEEIHI